MEHRRHSRRAVPGGAHGQGAWDVLNYSYPRKVGLEVLVFPRPGSGYSLATAEVDVVKGRDDRWRVDYWMITKFHGPGRRRRLTRRRL